MTSVGSFVESVTSKQPAQKPEENKWKTIVAALEEARVWAGHVDEIVFDAWLEPVEGCIGAWNPQFDEFGGTEVWEDQLANKLSVDVITPLFPGGEDA